MPDSKPKTKTPDQLRSARWFAPDDLRAFGHRSRAMQMGYAPEEWAGKPVIAILNTWSGRPALPHAFQDARRRCEARRAAVRRLPDRAAGAIAVGEPAEADHHALSQPAGDGRRGALARASRGWRRPHGRLRQDNAGVAAGSDQRRPADDLSAGRANAARQLERQGAGFGLGRVEILGRAPRRQDHRRGLGRCRGWHRAQLRHLHDHGHGGPR